MLTYRHIVAFWTCPRRLAYMLDGWENPEKPAPMMRGRYTHTGLAAHFRGQKPSAAVATALASEVDLLYPMTGEARARQYRLLQDAAAGAMELLERYISQYGSTLVPLFIEETIAVERDGRRFGGTPDLVALLDDALVVVEFKTGSTVHLDTLDTTGQGDYYCWLLEQVKGKAPSLLVLDVISPDYIVRHTRPPRLDQGRYIATWLQHLGTQMGPHLYNLPSYTFACATCPFRIPCKVRDQGGADIDILASQFIAGEKYDKRGVSL